MQVMLAENIRAFRREKKLTQEQLAEVLGVTVGTVSKWESAASTPDVGLIMEMADFFGTSVDLLLGYRQQSASLADTLAHLRALRHDRRYAEGRREAEKAVRRFPNSFDVVYQSAMLWQMAGLEEQDKAASRRAEALYGRALELFDQNTDPTISRVSSTTAWRTPCWSWMRPSAASSCSNRTTSKGSTTPGSARSSPSSRAAVTKRSTILKRPCSIPSHS